MPLLTDQDPLSSAGLRYFVRPAPCSSEPSEPATRPFSLRHAVSKSRPPARPAYRYSEELQIAVTDDGTERPLLVSDKDWLTKAGSDGQDGDEEHYDWEEI